MHRDLSLRNIMVSYASEVKIIDFGIARGDIGRYKTAPGSHIRTFAPTISHVFQRAVPASISRGKQRNRL